MGILSILDVVNKARKSIISLTILTSMLAASIVSSQDLGQLPFCGNVIERTISRRLLYVTTLDGKLTALDISNNGKVHWSVATAPGPLISSSIHRLELTNNGQLVRMIPSLSGGIYKFDGETIDPIPISAENLLSASYKFSEDLVVSGGKETRTYGVSARTGQILYECSMNGCTNNTNTGSLRSNSDDETLHTTDEFVPDHDTLLDDVIVVRRQTQTVRAVESRTGTERWNFSVGQHELDLIKSAECHDKPLSPLDMAILDTEIKIVVPDGIVCAFSKTDSSRLLWKYKFDHPIVSAWKNGPSDMLESIDLFSASRWIWNSGTNQFTTPTNISPSIYLGIHNKQIYIQESRNLRNEIVDKTNSFNYHLVSGESSMPQIPWKPIVGKNSALIPLSSEKLANPTTKIEGNELVSYENENKVAAISVLYATEYVNGNGFYLYSKSDLNKTENARCDTKQITNKTSANQTEDFNFNYDDSIGDTPVRIVILSLWFWWKEILVITLTSAIILNWFFAPRIRREREIVVIERHIPVPTAIEATEESVTGSSKRSLSESNNSQNSESFSSRFQGDFDLVQCLGKGGFGVVFEAKNKLDDCKYAVKRITLPNKKESRERVMREVKTLANCEHQNIVRYFQAWVETPPPGWQEDEDSKWLARDMSTSIEIETPDGTTLPQFSNSHKSMQDKNQSLESWMSNGTNENDISFQYRRSISELDDTDDDFAIEFRSDSKSCIISNGNGESIAIDVDKNIVDLDCSCLSDSFKIEFVNPADGDNDKEITSLTNNITSNRKRFQKRPNSLELTNIGDSKALIPLKNVNCQPLLHQPRIQNKVYLYIQMQLCRKQSLRDWLRDHKIETRQPHVKNIFEQIVDAVDYVHLKGLIHRDLKPSNIFFSLGGQIKIGDFGLVTDMAEMPNMIDEMAGGDIQRNGINLKPLHTQQVGTHLYMSPEQLQGKHYDFKVDIFSLGLIFFELLVFFGTEMERIITLKGLREGNFPTEFQNDFNDEFKLLKLMLSMQPHERPPTAELKQKLTSLRSWASLVDANGNNSSEINNLRKSLRTISETSFCNDWNND